MSSTIHPLCKRRRLFPGMVLMLSVLMMSCCFFGWHTEEHRVLLQGSVSQLLWLEHHLGFSPELSRHSSFVVWIISTVAFTVVGISTVIAYPRCLSPLTSLPGAVVLWPIYTSATRTELFLYVLPMHFSINATFTMAFDEPRDKLFSNDEDDARVEVEKFATRCTCVEPC